MGQDRGADEDDAAAGPVPGTVVARLRTRLPALVPSHQRIARLILSDPGAVIHLTVTDVAERSRTSEPTVVRFAQEIGLKGFTDLKIRLAAESIPEERRIHEDVTPGDEPAQVLEKVLRATASAMEEAAGTVDRKQFTRAVELLGNAAHVLCAGVGTSSPLAQDAAYRFRTIGIRAEAPQDAHVQHVTARMLAGDDVCLAFSHTGQTRETLATASTAKASGATTIVITSFFRSPIADIADIALVAGSRETNFRVEAMASRLAHISVLDALFVAICLTNAKRAQLAQRLTSEVLSEHRI